LIETGRRMEWTGQHYADAALEYALGPWILRRLPPLDRIEGFCLFGPPSLPALWWTRRRCGLSMSCSRHCAAAPAANR
jgi:hypothetical protein